MARSLKRKRDGADLETLDKQIRLLNPKEDVLETFASLPLSQLTARGLEASHFKTLTDVQKKALPFALRGSDMLCAAKTGSGKTLAFLVPVLENLYRKRWTEHDGLGALILSPTRELAIQIFEVLLKIGRYHTFSAGLVIGGKSLQEERERLGRMSILVCTPGRMLQHMDQTAAFEIGNLQMLVLDEADRIMDMGFQNTIDAIVEHLPIERHTMLFSATQTKKVSDLARLSLRDPEYVSVHEAASSATPSSLQQNYIVTPLPEKLDTLWSFIRSNLKSKILVFLSSGKQVRFVYEAFRHMQPGIPLMHLHGRQKQTARLDITTKFSASRHSCLFATDVVARGLDFPAVDWVIQLDCPEDANTYVHRVGRTARYERDGRAVLFLDPSEEEGMLKRLEHRNVMVGKINVKQKKQQSIKSNLQNMCFRNAELKYLGQKAFVSYVRSIHIQKDKDVFKLSELPLEEFSSSLGLPGAPKIKFGIGDTMKMLKNATRAATLSSEDEDDSEGSRKDDKQAKNETIRTKYDRMFERRNQDVLADHYTKLIDGQEDNPEGPSGDEDVKEDFMNVKQVVNNEATNETTTAELPTLKPKREAKRVLGVAKEPILINSKRKENLLKSKKNIIKLKEKGKKLVFDDEGNAHDIYELEDEEKFKSHGPAEALKEKFLEEEQFRLRTVDVEDKAVAKAKRKEKKEKKKAREAVESEDQTGGPRVELVPFNEGPHGDDSDRLPLEREAESRPKEKRPKKWFEEDSEDGGKPKRHREGASVVREPEDLVDLEAVATNLLT